MLTLMRNGSESELINNAKYIYTKASELSKIGSPYDIANYLNIKVQYVNFIKQKGVYTLIEDYKFVFISNELVTPIDNIVLLHEIGHDQLHSNITPYFLDANIFSTNTMEYEANLFAAHILLPDDKILPLIYDGYSEEQIASILETDENLVAIKADDLIRRGHHFDYQAYNSMFLK